MEDVPITVVQGLFFVLTKKKITTKCGQNNNKKAENKQNCVYERTCYTYVYVSVYIITLYMFGYLYESICVYKYIAAIASIDTR